jgi:hypothetical protein
MISQLVLRRRHQYRVCIVAVITAFLSLLRDSHLERPNLAVLI